MQIMELSNYSFPEIKKWQEKYIVKDDNIDINFPTSAESFLFLNSIASLAVTFTKDGCSIDIDYSAYRHFNEVRGNIGRMHKMGKVA